MILLYLNTFIAISQNIFKNYIDNDNKNIDEKLKRLLYIYRKKLKNKIQKYFTKYRMQILKLRFNKNNSYQAIKKYKVFNRLYNYQRIKLNKISNLKQKYLLDESNKYPYNPKINNYSIIIRKYNSFNNNISLTNNSMQISNFSLNNSQFNKTIKFIKTNEEEKNSDYIKINPKKNMILNHKRKIPIPNNNNQSNIKKYQKFYKNVRFKFDRITKIKNRKLNQTLPLKNLYSNSLKINIIQSNDENNTNNITSILNNNNSRKISSYCNHYLSKSIFNDFSPEKDNIVPKSENSLYFEGINNTNNKNSNLVYQTFKKKFNYLINKNNKRNIDSIHTKQNTLSTKNSISQNEAFEQYSNVKPKKAITLNYLLFPSKTNSINLTLDNLNKEEESHKNKPTKILNKKIIGIKLSNEELKKLKIFKKFKIGKKLTSISLSNNSFNNKSNKFNNILAERKNDFKINPRIIKEINNQANNLNKQKESTTTIQTLPDEKMMEIANYYLKEEETVDKSLIDDILSSKRSK